VRGANPTRDKWTAVPRKSQRDLDIALLNFRHSMREISRLPDVELKTIREMNEILADRPTASISTAEQAAMWPTIEKQVGGMSGWVIVPQDIDLSGLVAQTHTLMPTIERFELSN
jgi:hypothetical protein